MSDKLDMTVDEAILEIRAWRNEVERLRAICADLLVFAQRVAYNEGPWSGQGAAVTEAVVGYDIVKYIGMPDAPKYRAHRIRHGRYVTKSPFFATHKEAMAWIESQRGLDRDDKDRARIPPPPKS